MIVGKLTAFCLASLMSLPCFADAEKDSLNRENHLFYKELNYLGNMYEGTANPVALSHNIVRKVTDVRVGAQLRNGGLHDIDEGRRSRNLMGAIGGLQNFGNLDLWGYLDYKNIKEYDRQWNSTLFVTPTNPFILGDNIKSDVNTEVFSMTAGASYKFNDLFTGAVSINYLTGSASDQTDPRPKTNSMHVEIKPGVEFRLNDTHSVGVSAMADIFRSDMSYSVVNNNINYTYYIMKGMGDHQVLTSNDMTSYPRDYEGTRFQGALQWLVTPASDRFSNMFEVSYTHNKEISEDGGYAYTFKSGDYYRDDINIYDRLSIRSSGRFRQNFILRASYITGSGDWYDQKKMTDTQHGNIIYYQILNKSKVMETTDVNASLTYQADFMRNDMPDLTVNADLGFNTSEAKQYSTAAFKQTYTNMVMGAGAVKHFKFGRLRLSGRAGGYYSMPLGDPEYACAGMNMSSAYCAPAFEYIASAKLGFNVEADAYLPVTLYGYTTWMGVNLRFASCMYQGDSKFSDVYDSAAGTFVDATFNIKF